MDSPLFTVWVSEIHQVTKNRSKFPLSQPYRCYFERVFLSSTTCRISWIVSLDFPFYSEKEPKGLWWPTVPLDPSAGHFFDLIPSLSLLTFCGRPKNFPPIKIYVSNPWNLLMASSMTKDMIKDFERKNLSWTIHMGLI